MTLANWAGLSIIVFSAVAAGVAARGNWRTRAVAARLDHACEPIVAFSGRAAPQTHIFGLSVGELPRQVSTYFGLGEGGPFPNLLLAALPILTVTMYFLAGIFTALLAFSLTAALHQFTIKWLRMRNAQAFVEALPSFLERTRQFVLIGNTLQQGIFKALVNADPIVVKTLDPMVRRVRHGASFTEAMELVSRQIDLLEVHMLCACISANMRFGGRVAQNLANLTIQINNRLRLQREIQAATAETRASAMALLALTGAATSYVFLFNREYVTFFLETDTRKLVLAAIFVWPMIGLLVMRRILTLNY